MNSLDPMPDAGIDTPPAHRVRECPSEGSAGPDGSLALRFFGVCTRTSILQPVWVGIKTGNRVALLR